MMTFAYSKIIYTQYLQTVCPNVLILPELSWFLHVGKIFICNLPWPLASNFNSYDAVNA